MNVTQEQFEKYLIVQKSGVTNMFDRQAVCGLSGLDRDTVMEIIRDYEDLLAIHTDDIDEAHIQDQADAMRERIG